MSAMNYLKPGLLGILLILSVNTNASIVNIEPDDFLEGTNIENAYTGVTLSVSGRPNADVISINGFDTFNNRNLATTGKNVFGYTPVLGPIIPSGKVWDEATFGLLRADFELSTNFVSIDLLFDDDDIGAIWAYDSFDNLLGLELSVGDGRGPNPSSTVSILRKSYDIAYILAGGVNAEALFLDNLQVNVVPVPAAAWLFGSALLGFFGFSRRKVKS